MKYKEGDILYTKEENEYYVSKILRVDVDYGIYHVRTYGPMDREPQLSDLETLPVLIGHSPVAEPANAVLLHNQAIRAWELEGYLAYLQYTNFPEYVKEAGLDPKEIVAGAKDYFDRAYQATDERRYEDAVELYTKAYEAFPLFYEAVDNRAFVKMNMARWQEAIEDFELSLTINPDSVLAEFSIGECYMRQMNYSKAKEQFEKALKIDPGHALSREFLQKTLALMNT